MPYTILPELEIKTPKTLIAIDVEQDKDADAYIYCVAGPINRPSTRKTISKVFTSAESCSKYLFGRKWIRAILTGSDLSRDTGHLTLAGCFNWDVIENHKGFIYANPPDELKEKHNYCLLSMISLSNFYNRKISQIVRDKNGEFEPDYVAFCQAHKVDQYIDKHDTDIETEGINKMTRACISHAWASVWALARLQNQIQKLGSNIEVTSSLTAQKLHRRQFLHKDCQIMPKLDPMNNENNVFISQSIYGGRKEYFTDGEIKHITGIDINSSYPNVMRNKVYPDMIGYKERTGISPSGLEDIMGKFEGLASVLIKAPYMKIPFLPVNIMSEDNIYGYGQWLATYTFPELRRAIKLGYEIKMVYKVGYCKPTKVPLFKNYVDTIYKLKLKPELKDVAKALLVGLSGKFGQRIGESSGWHIMSDKELSEMDGEDYDPSIYKVGLNGQMNKYITPSSLDNRGYSAKAYPLIYAYILSYARIELWNTMNAIGIDKVHYADTDAIYADTDAVNRAILRGYLKIDDTKLGYWKIEHEDVTMEIKGIMNYRIFEDGEWQYTISGTPKDKQAEMWDKGYCTIKLIRKRPMAIRHDVKLNSYYDVNISQPKRVEKRVFNGNQSEPRHIKDIFEM